MPTMGQMDLQAEVMTQQQQTSMIIQSGQFSDINNSTITQPSVVSGIESITGQGMIKQSLNFQCN